MDRPAACKSCKNARTAPTGAPLDVRVNSRLVARAEAIAVGEKCGIRIIEILGGKDA